MSEIDKADLRLLSVLQIDAKTPIAKLAEVCASSPSSVQRRLRRLRTSEVIQRDTIQLDRHLVGFAVKALVAVELERDSAAETDLFKRRAVKDPNVQHCYCIAGEADFMLIVVARDVDDYEAFTQRFFVSDTNIRKFRTSMVVSEQKASCALPLVD